MQFATISAICWLVFIVYWVVSSLQAKRTITGPFWNSWWIRILVLVIVVVAASSTRFQIISMYKPTEFVGWLGIILVAGGIALVIWARMHLASNWGMPMSVKENPELVTSGPYTYIRHPIYTGVLIGMFGNMLIFGPIWLVIFFFAGAYFVYSATQEEKIMQKEFPDQYPSYRARSKMLIPFIF